MIRNENNSMPFVWKKIVYSKDNQYLHCEDLSCKCIISNLCVAYQKGHYVRQIASHGIYKEIPFFQCNQCNNILDLQALTPTDCMKKALKESEKREGKSFDSIKALKADLKS